MKCSAFIPGLLSLLFATPCWAQSSEAIRLNQVGYLPHQEKIAVCEKADVSTFQVLDAKTRQVVLTAKAGKPITSPFGKKRRTYLNFSSLDKTGEYILRAGKAEQHFFISKAPLHALAQSALKAFYYQRTAMPIAQPYADKWSRPEGHSDHHVWVHGSAATPNRPEGTVIDSPAGWYDAGDYNKYIVNSAYTIGLIQSVYLLFPDYFDKLKVDIPEQNNDTPDVLDEMYYNLKWMLTMQDPDDGGVYHKLTTPDFEGFVMPSDCRQQRYVVQKSTAATFDFAAVMAQSARVFRDNKDYPDFADKAQAAALKAYEWGVQHPAVYYRQNDINKSYKPAITTGEYGDNNLTDEHFWAASELYLTTGEARYLNDALQVRPQAFQTPGWGDVSGLGVYAWLNPAFNTKQSDAAEVHRAFITSLLSYCDKTVALAANSSFCSPYGNSAADFFWGGLSEGCCSQAIALVYGFLMTGQKEYLLNARRNMDYLLGRNATGYCYVTGAGTKSPMHPHHRLSAADGVEAPIPGLLVGGPNRQKQDASARAVYASDAPDECYADQLPSYASNEIAINWNASLVALTSALDALSFKR